MAITLTSEQKEAILGALVLPVDRADNVDIWQAAETVLSQSLDYPTVLEIRAQLANITSVDAAGILQRNSRIFGDPPVHASDMDEFENLTSLALTGEESAWMELRSFDFSEMTTKRLFEFLKQYIELSGDNLSAVLGNMDYDDDATMDRLVELLDSRAAADTELDSYLRNVDVVTGYYGLPLPELALSVMAVKYGNVSAQDSLIESTEMGHAFVGAYDAILYVHGNNLLDTVVDMDFYERALTAFGKAFQEYKEDEFVKQVSRATVDWLNQELPDEALVRILEHNPRSVVPIIDMIDKASGKNIARFKPLLVDACTRNEEVVTVLQGTISEQELPGAMEDLRRLVLEEHGKVVPFRPRPSVVPLIDPTADTRNTDITTGMKDMLRDAGLSDFADQIEQNGIRTLGDLKNMPEIDASLLQAMKEIRYAHDLTTAEEVMVIALLSDNRTAGEVDPNEIITKALSRVDAFENSRSEEGREARGTVRRDAERCDRLARDIMKHVTRGGK